MTRDAPDIRLDNPAFFISGIRPDAEMGGPDFRLDTEYLIGYPAKNQYLEHPQQIEINNSVYLTIMTYRDAPDIRLPAG
jgi:hypothetical protein